MPPRRPSRLQQQLTRAWQDRRLPALGVAAVLVLGVLVAVVRLSGRAHPVWWPDAADEVPAAVGTAPAQAAAAGPAASGASAPGSLGASGATVPRLGAAALPAPRQAWPATGLESFCPGPGNPSGATPATGAGGTVAGAKQGRASVQRSLLASADPLLRAGGLLLARRSGELALLARQTPDPRIQTLALAACAADERRARGGDDCAGLNAERWLNLEPDNGAAWMALAVQAAARDDQGAVQDALDHAARARYLDHHQGVLPALVAAALPESLPWQDRAELLLEAGGMGTGLELEPYAVAARFCAADAVQDANRRPTCEALADTLLRRGSNLMDGRIGLAIAEHAGWDADRLSGWRQDLTMLQNTSLNALGADPALGADCAQVQGMARYLARAARQGELAALRALRPGP
jgi:hypothetical protein